MAMEQAVENLEQMFDKAEADVKYLTKCLERKIDLKEGSDDRPNPLRLMKDLENVKDQHSHLKQEISGIQSAQKEAVDFLRSQLATMSEMVQKLENQTGQHNPEVLQSSLTMVEELSQLLGVPPESIMQEPATDAASGGSSLCGMVASASNVAVTDGGDLSDKQQLSDIEGVQGNVNFEPTAAERRLDGSEFVPVSEEEFASVSELVRGRAKLEEVNKTYSVLWEHFKVNGNTQELTLKEMNSIGLRVTGATGQSKLKVLRALKLLKIAKTGNVVLT